ncbi:MAG TPA: NrfD/PsrC family molybdoenzyme membrane anchor subunit [Longimicrobiales bacterium]|nr:NrfD/PsrC family molybdoenzyme membrane anchor subunit [Longimicrobiales bacterium]
MATVTPPPAAPPPRRSPTHPHVGSYAQVNRDIFRMLSRPGRGWWMLFIPTLAGVGLLGFAFAVQVVLGIGMTGLMNPVGWGVYITTFVFWVGIAHSGTLISAILYLFRAPWRQSIYRAAEAMTVFAVMTAGLFPIIHLGRPWVFYYLLPYPNQRLIWPNFRSPLLWDVFAVGTYFTVSAVFFYIGMIPDIAAARDSTEVRWRRKLYTAMALGWTGTDREWKHFSRAYLYLAALATPLVLSVHSVVSWDFAMSIVPGWHTTIFAPYFVAGAIFSGLAMVITILIPMRKAFGLQAYLTPRHFDAMSKLILLTALIVTYAYATEYFMAWYSFEVPERNAFFNRAFGDYWWATWIMITCNAFVPQLLWFRNVRTSIGALFTISIFINIGMWFERFVIIIVSLSHEYVPWQWGTYMPSWVEIAILAGSFAWFFMWFLLFIRLLPPISVAELKEVLPSPLRADGAAAARVGPPADHGPSGHEGVR